MKACYVSLTQLPSDEIHRIVKDLYDSGYYRLFPSSPRVIACFIWCYAHRNVMGIDDYWVLTLALLERKRNLRTEPDVLQWLRRQATLMTDPDPSQWKDWRWRDFDKDTDEMIVYYTAPMPRDAPTTPGIGDEDSPSPVPAPTPGTPPSAVMDDGEAEDDADGEEWVSTWDKPTDTRLQSIVDFMVEDGRANYTRQQIEIGAGYRRPDDTLDPDTYKKMSRRLQRDLQLLIEDEDIVLITKDKPKHKGGFKNKIYLYALAPDKEDATEK